MASIRIKTNIDVVSKNIRDRLDKLKDKDYLIRPVAFDVIDLMTKRIHIDGKAADDSQIGTYDTSYLKLRERKYNRKGDTKIIVSLTRQLENDWSVIATPNGYGIGFLNAFNVQKMRWVEAIKNKKIAFMSESEKDHALKRLQELVKRALNDK